MNEVTRALIPLLVSATIGVFVLLFITKTVRKRQDTTNKTNQLLEKMSNEIPAQIQKLAELHQDGTLTDSEFQAKKQNC